MAETSESNVWGQDPLGSGRAESTFVTRTPNVKQAAMAMVVRDDWDDDDDDDGEVQEKDVPDEKPGHAKGKTQRDGITAPGLRGDEEDSDKIWEEANKRPPMPDLIVASASTGQSSAPPPPAALQPTLRILKRPSPNASANNTGGMSSNMLALSSPSPTSGSGSGGTSPVPRGTLAEREAQYQEARSRIFGEKEKSGQEKGQAGLHSGGVVIVRDPLGPASEPSGQERSHNRGRLAKGFGERRGGKK